METVVGYFSISRKFRVEFPMSERPSTGLRGAPPREGEDFR